MTVFWSYWIAGLTLLLLVLLAGLFWVCVRRDGIEVGVPEGEPLAHSYDEDIFELNQPVPRWWGYLFIFMFVAALLYLVLYPGLVAVGNQLNWSSTKDHRVMVGQAPEHSESKAVDQYQALLEHADQTYNKRLAQYDGLSYETLMQNEAALEVGARLFQQNCIQCHGMDAQGGDGFPNLRDQNWIYGGMPEQIAQSIRNGRQGMMPPRGGLPISDADVDALVHYLRSLSDLEPQTAQAEQGRAIYMRGCFACHGMQAEGNIYIGAPNLSDSAWLYGDGDIASIKQTLLQGRHGVMPSWSSVLGERKIRLLAAYLAKISVKDHD